MKDYQSLRRVRELFLQKLLAEEPNHPWGEHLRKDGTLPHYKNGREARVGDIVASRSYDGKGALKTGVLISVSTSETACNGTVVPLANEQSVVLSLCLHADDVFPVAEDAAKSSSSA